MSSHCYLKYKRQATENYWIQDTFQFAFVHNLNKLSIQSCNINVYIKPIMIKEFLVVNPSSAEISGGECYGEEEGGGGHNPRFYCQLTGFPATLAALSGIALCHDSLTSSQWRDRDLLINAECGAGAGQKNCRRRNMTMTAWAGRRQWRRRRGASGADFHLASCSPRLGTPLRTH